MRVPNQRRHPDLPRRARDRPSWSEQTNFGQAGDLSDVFRMRGGYSEGWTVFWITAHFLNAAAQFDAMGVDLDHR